MPPVNAMFFMSVQSLLECLHNRDFVIVLGVFTFFVMLVCSMVCLVVVAHETRSEWCLRRCSRRYTKFHQAVY